MTPHQAKATLKELADDGNRIFFTRHAEERMIERNITRMQILKCLQSGRFEEEPAQDPRGSWSMRIRSYSAGESIAVAVALDVDSNGDYAVVITVMH